MTMHIILPTAERGIVWVTDTTVGMGTANNFASVDKILYLKGKNAACSNWGNAGLLINNELFRWLKNSHTDFSQQGEVIELLEKFCVISTSSFRIDRSKPGSPNVILVTCLDSEPRIYYASLGLPPVVYAVDDLICAGDEDSLGRIFVEHYYDQSGRTMNEALFLGVHAMRKAHQQKAAYIGPPNAWVCKGGEFRRLTGAELAQCIKASEALDKKILHVGSNFILDTTK